MFHALYRIAREEGVAELYRGLLPSVIGVIPYAGANYCAYDSLCTLFRRVTKRKRIDPLSTLVIGSLAGAFAATATFPLEVSRKQVRQTVVCCITVVSACGGKECGVIQGLTRRWLIRREGFQHGE